MGQYRLKKENDLENLESALTKYQLDSIHITPFSLGNRTEHLYEKLEKSILNFTEENGLTLYIDNKEFFNFPLKDYAKGFAVEYQDEIYRRLWSEKYHPDDNGLPTPKYSALRIVLDDLLLEIKFKGKIEIEPDGILSEYWKIKK